MKMYEVSALVANFKKSIGYIQYGTIWFGKGIVIQKRDFLKDRNYKNQ